MVGEASISFAPLLLFVVGPPAVGKSTVSAAIAQRTGLRVYRNHETVELVLRFFPFGTPAFQRLIVEFRRRILEEVAGSDLPGMIFSFVRAFDRESDDAMVEEFAAIFRNHGGRVLFLELEASRTARLLRNAKEHAHTVSIFSPDMELTREQVIEFETMHVLNSGARFDGFPDYLKIDNTDLSPDEVAERAIEAFEINNH